MERERWSMGVRTIVKDVWERLAGVDAAAGDARMGERKTAMLPSILSPYNPAGRAGQHALPKPTAANLRKFAETPVVRRAINVVKDKIASMDWQVRVRRGYDAATVQDAETRMNVLRRSWRSRMPRTAFVCCGSRCWRTCWWAGFAR